MHHLFKTRGFAPLVFMIFFNAFIDLGHKIVIQNIIFKLYDGSEQIVLTAIVNALILLPFILLFRPAGLASDRYAKASILRLGSLAAFFLTLCISACYYLGYFNAAFGLIFILAIQSAFYAPAKYGFLKELIDNTHLTRANGIAQTMATTGILAGIFLFSILFEAQYSASEQSNESLILQAMFPLSWLLIACSLTETILAWTLPIIACHKIHKTESISSQLKTQKRNPVLWAATIGTAVFWCVGQMLVAAYPAFAKAEIGIDNTVVIQGLLAMIGLGIMFGSIIAGRLSRQHIELNLLAIGGIGVFLAVLMIPLVNTTLLAIPMFLTLGICGGLFVVPLNALIQYCSPPEKLGSVLANTVLIQNLCMLSSLLITVAAGMQNFSVKTLLIFITLFSGFGILYVYKLLPQVFLRCRISPWLMPNKHIHIEGFNRVKGYKRTLYILNDDGHRQEEILQMTSPYPLTPWQEKLNKEANMIISKNQWQDIKTKSIPKQLQTVQLISCDICEAADKINIHFSDVNG